MKYPLLKSLLALGTIGLACSCSEKSPTNKDGEVSFVPCEDALYLIKEGYIILQDFRVTDINGNQVGTAYPVQFTNYVIIKDLNQVNLVNQVDLSDPKRVKTLPGDPTKCSVVPPSTQVTSCVNAWYLAADKNFLIYDDYTVTDESGTTAGIWNFVPNSTSTIFISDLSGNLLVNNINLTSLPIISGDGIFYTITEPAFLHIDNTGRYLIYSDLSVTDPSGNLVGSFDIATGTIKSKANGATITQADLSKLPLLTPDSKCAYYIPPVIPSSSSVYVPPIVSSSSAYVPPVQSSSSANPPKSSSSQVKSSSSSQPKSSSSAPVTGQCPSIKVKSGGKSGSGWATRYWDCCKPHCSWPEHANGNYSRQCTNKGKNESTDWGGGSVCSGGGLMTCTSQIPFTIDGCNEMGFAFAAVPASDGGSCGKCYQLTFTGKGKYSTDDNHRSIKGKKLIIMTTNIGGDVQQGQFDIMIPGGGVGMFNGCSSMGWGPQGEQYGGLLSDCEKESNYKPTATLKCYKNKCESVFSNDSEAKKGCLFLANFMSGAGNPLHDYVEVECPEVLKAKY